MNEQKILFEVTDNNVVIKLTYQMSIRSLVASPTAEDMQQKSNCFLIATSKDSKHKDKIGKKCVMLTPPTVRLDIPSNERGSLKLHKLYSTMSDGELRDLIKETKDKIEVIEYAIYNEFSLGGFYL
jgi:hypothetical protein